VALGLEIGNTIHNFELGGEIQFVKAHELLKHMKLQGWVELVRMGDAIAQAG
jgi:hypothetical protein